VGSYFVSNYPPYSQWSADYLDQVRTAFDTPPSEVPLGLYLHIPFCRKRCKFCYFKVFTDKNSEQVERYQQALAREIELVSRTAAMGQRPFRFVYFGGGTPSFLSEKQLRRLVDRLAANISWDQAEEVTFECEPGTLSEPKVHALKELGVTRLSLGVEHFDDQILRENGRAHESGEIYRAWPWIQQAAFDSVNIDLIAGMVGDSDATWETTVGRALELQPDSVTIYQMELPYNTVYSKDILGKQVESPVADWPTKRRWVSEAFDRFLAAGYEISSAYTLVRNRQEVHFSYRDNLWRGSDLLSVGIASFGHLSGVHYQNLPEWDPYCEALDQGELPLGRGLPISAEQALIRELILQLKRGYLEPSYFAAKYEVDILARWKQVWDDYQQRQWLDYDQKQITLTRAGLLRVDSLLPAFFESQFQSVRYT
jgi:oxygen-independent coproporphyrinogen-3 oxidase